MLADEAAGGIDVPRSASSGIRKDRPPQGAPPIEGFEDETARRPRRRREEEWDDEPSAPRRGKYEDCPHCGCPGHADRVSFTWWGGALGPALFTHVRCRECGSCYNGKTGGDNTTGIIVYTAIGIGLCLAAAVVILLLNN